MVIDLIVLALGIALEPLPLTAFIIVLASLRGVRKGAAYVAGWFASLSVVVALTLLATGNTPPALGSTSSQAVLVVKLVIGAGLLVVAARQRRKLQRPRVPKPTPKWQQQIDQASPVYAAGVAVLLQPWGLIAAGAATVVQAHLASWQDGLVLVAFALLGSSTYLAMQASAMWRPEPTLGRLELLRGWLDEHTDEVVMWVAFVVGLWLVTHSAYLLIT